jgi:hypothetical protein
VALAIGLFCIIRKRSHRQQLETLNSSLLVEGVDTAT